MFPHPQPQPQPAPAGAAPRPSDEQSIRVVLADDHALMRRSLFRLLDDESDLEVVAEAGDLGTAIRHVRRHLPQVLVIDLSMSNGSSLEAIRRLQVLVPGTQIVVLTMEESSVFAQEALAAGAIGFVLKQAADSELVQAVRSTARGTQYLSPRLAARRASVGRSSARDGLTRGETEVLRLIALGHTSAEIEGELHLSTRTVRSDRAQIHEKLGLATRAQLVRHALRRGLLET